MWSLERESAGGLSHHFLSGVDYVVGRKNCTVLIEDDQSISRAHATFSVRHPLPSLAQPHIMPALTIKDSSKYGTFINGEKMEIGSSRALASGDKVTFGVYNSKFRVTYKPLVVCSSCLSNLEKNAITQSLLALGGHLVNNWTERCTHLVMTSVKVTIKTLCALICCRSIVKPEYFAEMIEAIKQKKPLPALTSFIPIIDEPSLQSDSLDLSENTKRKTVFTDKIFLFLTAKQHKKLSAVVQFGGGTSKLLTGELDDKSLLENPNVCVIDVGTAESQGFPAWITSILDILQSKGLRTVPEAEIGLSVIYMSTQKYCNPLRGSEDRNDSEKHGRQSIMGYSQSSSMAVDETVLPPATFNTTAYVADTEPQSHPDNWVDISGVREVKETPKTIRRSSKINPSKDQDVEVGADCRTALFQDHLRPTEERPCPSPQAEAPALRRQKVSQKIESSNKIQNYFQPVSKKRDRVEEEDDGESSTAKLCRMEKESSQSSSHPTKDTVPPKKKNDNVVPLKVPDTELVGSSKNRLGGSFGQDSMDTATRSQPKDSVVKKRKEPEDVVEESDLENEEECGDEVRAKSNTNASVSHVKRPRVETNEDFGEDFSMDSGDSSTAPALPVQTIKTEPDIKREPLSLHQDTKISIRAKQEDDDGHPSRVVVLELQSLVVSQPTRNSQTTSKTYQENGTNFKKFRKAAYPGAGSFPHIIGGSDLIAHNGKKNSEFEQWLRQEVEEQTQQAKEQSLAEELFRYNPKTVKGRR